MDIKNLTDHMTFSEESITKKVLFADNNLLSFVLNVKSGQRIAAHRHEHSSLVIGVLAGKGEVSVGFERAWVNAGAVLAVKGEEDFGVPTVEEDLSLFVTISPNPSNEIYSREI
jgi:quercetin dioxygenase-like cupin family protein